MEAFNISLNDLFLSILRWVIGLILGCSLGLLFGLIGSFKPTYSLLKFLNDFFRSIPIIGLVPVIQMNLGINEYGKIGLIAWAVMFPVWITVRNALETKMEIINLVLQASKITGFEFFRLFTFPKVLGGFLKGIELAIGIAWLALVAAEWIGTYTQGLWAGGLGYKLLTGYELNNWETVHVGILLFGLLGVSSSYLWRVTMYFIFKKNNNFNPL